MAKLLSPEEYEATFGGGRRAEAPQAGRGNLFGSAVDRTQAALLGIAEEYGVPFAEEARRRNQFEADETARRYYETNPDRIQSFRQIRSARDLGSFGLDLGVQTAPALIGLGGAALVGGVPGALAFGTALGKGEILQGQREEAGQTDLLSASVGGLAFGAVDTLTGLGGAVVRRSLGTGIRGLDEAGTRALDNITGLKGVAARSAVAGGKSAAVEAAGETFQQGTVIGGRMAVNPDLEFFDPENVAELQESAFAGGLLGFGLGSFGGRRTRLERDEPVNLMGDTTAQPPATAQTAASRGASAEQINQMVGLGRPSRDAKTYTAEFEEAFREPSGRFVQDPQTGIERELTMGEYYAQLQGLEPPIAGATASVPAAEVDPRRQILRDTYGIVPTKPALQLVDAIEAEGLALDSPIVADVINFAAQKPMSAKRLEQAIERLDKAIIESRKAPIVSPTPPVLTPTPAAATQAAAPVVPVDGQAPTVSAAPVEAAPVAPVTQAVTPAPQGFRYRITEQPAYDGVEALSAEDADFELDVLLMLAERGRLTPTAFAASEIGKRLDTAAIMTINEGLRSNPVATIEALKNALTPAAPAPAPAPVAAPTAPAAEQTAPDILNLVFGEQDADIIRSALAGQSAQQIADDLAARGVTGRSRSMIANKIAGEKAVREQWPRKIAEAKRKHNLTDAQIEDALRTQLAPDADVRSEVEREMGLGFARATIADPMGETEAVEAGLENVVGSVGGSTSAVQGFTDLQKKVDSVLDQIEKTTDPQTLAALQTRLEELAMEVRAVERSEQARVFADAEASKETESAADTKAELEAPVERAAPKKAEAAPEKPEGAKKPKGEKKSKEEKEAEAEELSAEGKAARAAADAKLAAEAAAKRDTDRKGLAVGDTVMNPKLGTGVVKSFAGDGDATTVTVAFQSGQTKELSVKLAKLEKTAGKAAKAARESREEKTQTGVRVRASTDREAAYVGATTTVDFGNGTVAMVSPSSRDVFIRVGNSNASPIRVRDTRSGNISSVSAMPESVPQSLRQPLFDLAVLMEADAPASEILAAQAKVERAVKALNAKGDGQVERGDAVTDRGEAPTGGEVGEAGAYTAAELTADIKDFMRVDTLGKGVIIVDKPTDLQDLRDVVTGITNVRSFGWTRDGKAILIASRIRKGTGRAKFMHEVGSHLGMQRLLPPETFNRLVDQVLTWAARTDNSLETRLAKAAVGRVPENTNPASVRNEIAAYFVEEATLAGVNPTAMRQLGGPVAKWMRSLFDAMKRALIKLGVKVETLTARDVVNLAYGAASLRLESDGVAPRGTELEFGVQVGPDTAAFKRWFGDSKVVGADGEPLVVYHGSTADITAFDPAKSPSGNRGFYFTQSTALASVYAKVFQPEKGGSIYPVYLSIKNPLVIDGTRFSPSGIKGRVARLLDPKRYKEAQETQTLKDALTDKDGLIFIDKDVVLLREAGYDGVVIKRSPTSAPEAMVAFSPTQIKSAVGNDGTYGLADPNIEFGMEPLKKPTTSTVEKNINALLPPVARRPARNTLSAIERMGRKSLDYVVFTSDLIKRASEAGIKSAKQFGDLLAARATKVREMEFDVERVANLYTLVPEAERGTGPKSVNQFIFDSTREGKWGYDSSTMKANPEMKARFDALSPESQNLVRTIFEHGDKMLALKKKTVLDTTASEYDALIAAAKVAGDTAAEARLTNEKANTLKRFKSLFAIREGIPYAPIKRTGDHAVVAKSAEYLAAEEKGDTKLIEKLQADGDHYHVSFADSATQAENLRQQLEDQGAFSTVDNFEREVNADALYAGESTLKALTALRSKADAQADAGDKSAAKLRSIISQLYLEALAEGSARKSEMKRRGVAGEVDMLSSFALQGRADANFLASLEFNPKVQETFQKMRKERNLGGNRQRKSELFNELAKRYEGSLETAKNPWLDKLTRLSSIYFLASSPSYYLQNLTQPWMMSLPAMAGTHDYLKAATELTKAYGQLGDVFTSVKLGNQLQQQWDFSKVPADVREAIVTLADRGRIDIGLDTELGEFQIEGQGALTARWNKIDKGLRVMVQKAEAVNRLSTAMAAYRLEFAKTKNKDAALDYADRILQETHGDYTRFNAPRAFNNPVGKVALQFRKFQLIQLTFYAKLINDAYTGKDRAVALKTLGYALGHTAVLAGVKGLPGYAAISWALGAILGSDDEEFDLTDELRKYIGDEELATMILRGAPTVTGMDISGKIGAGTMLSIMPFSNADLTTRSGQMEAFGTAFTGASGGMIVRGLDGGQLMMSGDFYKGLEMMMPKGISDAMKSYRIADEGMTRRNGDVILPPDEVNSLDAVFQALGIMPAKQSVVYEKRQRFRDLTMNFTDRTRRVRNNYVAAMRKGDTAAAAEAREAWKSLQDAKVRNGLKRQPLSDLLKAPREQQRRERNTRDGIQFTRSTQRAAEEIAER